MVNVDGGKFNDGSTGQEETPARLQTVHRPQSPMGGERHHRLSHRGLLIGLLEEEQGDFGKVRRKIRAGMGGEEVLVAGLQGAFFTDVTVQSGASVGA